jgi:hypothetical protein
MELMTETVVLRVKGAATGGFDDYGNPTYSAPSDVTSRAWYEPRGSSEDTAAKDQVVDGYWVYLPLSAPLDAADAVLIEGVAYQVVGDPGRQPGGFLVPGFLKAAVERVTG